jgi:hypothetical protein
MKFSTMSIILSVWLQERPDSSVGVALGYWMDGRGSIFLYSTTSRPALGPTHPPIQWVLAVVSPGVKRQRLEDDHSSSSSAEIKNGVAILALPNTFS